ncbi:hypothetical protein LCGC14_1552730 [marine sediment metagenome]|uniref:Uncharacterized protein n=1 Tax=marine sediment metagenome TaxID=412755 RepID=A0A0F9IPX0_9ZZZZ
MSKGKRLYNNVPIPTAMVEDVDFIIKKSGLYRSNAEFFIDAGRQRYIEIIKNMYKKKKLNRIKTTKSKK